MAKDYLAQLLQNMQASIDAVDRKLGTLDDKQSKRLDSQDKKLEQIHTQTVKTNGRVSGHDKDIKGLTDAVGHVEKQLARRPLIASLPPNVLYILAAASLIVVAIIASRLGIDVSGLIP